MKYTIRTPGPNNHGDEYHHATVRLPSNGHYRSLCGHRCRAWRKVKNGTVTCRKCLKCLKALRIAA